MKPLALTVEEEAIIRRDLDVFGHLQQRRLCAEIDALRRLPVLPTCGDCGHCIRLYPQGAECWHPKSRSNGHLHVAIDRDAPPPLNVCPLREGEAR
jgi:hypothetical protein